jgi:hypothetical protein
MNTPVHRTEITHQDTIGKMIRGGFGGEEIVDLWEEG